jgi:antitoxin (DNA-binding transcriptional repressor) of toxin-antitoxin stability system
MDNVATWSYITSMKLVGIRELKNRLSEYIRLVRNGERVLVTDRGVIVAEIRPPGTPIEEDPYPLLTAAARQGQVRLGAPNRPDLYPKLGKIFPSGTALRWLDESRGDR